MNHGEAQNSRSVPSTSHEASRLTELALLVGVALVFVLVLIFRWVVPAIAIITHGPVVGAVTPASATIFIRTSTASHVRIVYGSDASLASAMESKTTETQQSRDFTAQIKLEGLAPA